MLKRWWERKRKEEKGEVCKSGVAICERHDFKIPEEAFLHDSLISDGSDALH